MTRETIKTSKQEIVKYWAARVDECGLSVDWSEANERCWRCGYESTLERCHIVPHFIGGIDAPENLVLLCNSCHHEAPNIDDPEFFWDWLRAHSAGFYDTYWSIRAAKEYEFIYKVTIAEEVIKYKVKENEFKDFLENNMKSCSFHYGHTRLTVSTRAGLFRMFFKKKAKEHNIPVTEFSPYGSGFSLF